MKEKEFYWTTALVVLTRTGDLATTYLVTPDLKNETNILVKTFGLGWTGSLLIQATAVALVVCLNYYHFFRAREEYPNEPGWSFRDFSTFYYFGMKSGWTAFLYKNPKNLNVLCDFTGYVAPRVLIPFSCIVTASSTMLLISGSYRDFYKTVLPFIFIIVPLLLILVGRRYFLKKYRVYRNKS